MISLRDNIKFLQIFVFYKYENNIYLYIWFIYSLLIFFFFFFFFKMNDRYKHRRQLLYTFSYLNFLKIVSSLAIINRGCRQTLCLSQVRILTVCTPYRRAYQQCDYLTPEQCWCSNSLSLTWNEKSCAGNKTVTICNLFGRSRFVSPLKYSVI